MYAFPSVEPEPEPVVSGVLAGVRCGRGGRAGRRPAAEQRGP